MYVHHFFGQNLMENQKKYNRCAPREFYFRPKCFFEKSSILLEVFYNIQAFHFLNKITFLTNLCFFFEYFNIAQLKIVRTSQIRLSLFAPNRVARMFIGVAQINRANPIRVSAICYVNIRTTSECGPKFGRTIYRVSCVIRIDFHFQRFILLVR